MKFGAYVWQKKGREWVLQPKQALDHAAACFGTSQAMVLLKAEQLPAIRVLGVEYAPDSNPDEFHPAHRNAWWNHHLPKGCYFGYGEGRGYRLPDAERVQVMGLHTPESEWVAIAGLGINEFAGDSAPTVEQCLERAVSFWRYFKEENGLL